MRLEPIIHLHWPWISVLEESFPKEVRRVHPLPEDVDELSLPEYIARGRAVAVSFYPGHTLWLWTNPSCIKVWIAEPGHQYPYFLPADQPMTYYQLAFTNFGRSCMGPDRDLHRSLLRRWQSLMDQHPAD